MSFPLQPLQVPSLKAACVQQLEHLILSGKLKINEKLPPERELASQLQVSRPVIHEAIVDLAAKGLVTIIPRQGTVINDYRSSGSCALLTSLLDYHEGSLDPAFFTSLLDMRFIFEGEIARCAAQHHCKEDLNKLQKILEREHSTTTSDTQDRVDLDFNFHLQLALASGNLVYPLILNSFKPVYTNLTAEFYTLALPQTVQEVYIFHNEMLFAVQSGNQDLAHATMQHMLKHGAEKLQQLKLAPPLSE
jgi:GntR family transcriptional regulator, transcriptional repressor for pyruvate dehydrogenase complex